MSKRFKADDLIQATAALFQKAGAQPEVGQAMAARVFVEQREKGVALSDDIQGLPMPCLENTGYRSRTQWISLYQTANAGETPCP
ncbi:MAG: hypothetical protein VW268_02440 [Rhodospirillaceae bacterium]